MTTQVNWKKIRDELQRFANVDKLKTEVQRIGTELRNLDFQSVLSPTAQAKVKVFERRYVDLMRTIQQGQRQMDREFNRILRQIKVHRSDVSKVVAEQKSKLEKASKDMQKRFAKTTKAKAKAKPVRKKSTVRKKKTK